jgi:hypothetical protein
MEVAMSDMKDEQFPAAGPEEPSALRPIRVWPAIVLVALFWAFWVAHYLAPLDPGIRFLSRMAAFGVLLLGFLIWWLSRRSISWRDRLLAIALWIAGTFVAERLADKTLASAFSMVLSSLPFVITGWVLWMWIARRRSPACCC